MVGQFCTYPLDVMRRRMQLIPPTIPGRSQYSKSMIEVFQNIVRNEGYRGLTKGFSMNIVKGPIALSVSLTTFDLLKRYTAPSPTKS